jgi:hypothetical protein
MHHFTVELFIIANPLRSFVLFTLDQSFPFKKHRVHQTVVWSGTAEVAVSL